MRTRTHTYTQVYRNSGGLKYHLERGTCRVTPPGGGGKHASPNPNPSNTPSTSTPAPPTDSRVLIFLPERRPRIKVGAGPYLCRACPPFRAKHYKSKAGIIGHYERQHQGRDVYESLMNDSPPAPPMVTITLPAPPPPVSDAAR